jgi:hypothetical protein
MSYTVLRVTEGGVVLFDAHQSRFEVAGENAVQGFLLFAAEARPGIYSLTWRGGVLDVVERATTSLFEGIPVRHAISPFAGSGQRLVKTPPPNPYQALRQAGTATLLTSATGDEIYESCTAAVIGWSGHRFVAPPQDRPCLDSTALRILDAAGALERGPILRESRACLALVNAVAGLVVPMAPGRDPFPAEGRALAARIFRESTKRPPGPESGHASTG